MKKFSMESRTKSFDLSYLEESTKSQLDCWAASCNYTMETAVINLVLSIGQHPLHDVERLRTRRKPYVSKMVFLQLDKLDVQTRANLTQVVEKRYKQLCEAQGYATWNQVMQSLVKEGVEKWTM